MLIGNRSQLQRYGAAVLAVAIALILTLLSGSLLKPTPTTLFFTASILSVWYGGLGAGVLAVMLSILAIHYFFIPPLYSLTLHLGDFLRAGAFTLGILICHSLIGNQRRKEAELHKQEQLLRLITDSLPTPVSYVDRSLRYQFNNQAYETWLGISRKTLTGKHLKEVLEPSNSLIIEHQLISVLTGHKVSFERSLTFQDGSVRHLEATYIPDVNPQGDVKGFVVLVTDITKHKQAEQILQENHAQLEKRVAERTTELTRINAALQAEIIERELAEEKLKFQATVLSQVSDVVLAVDSNYRIIYWNQAAKNFYQVKAEAAMGRLQSELYQSQWLTPETEQIMADTLNTTGYWSGEVIQTLKSGQEKWVEARISALKDAEKTPIGYLAVIRDITTRKQTEETLLISDAALQQMPDAILLTDLQGTILRWMGKAEQIFGYSAAEAIGQPVNFLHHPEFKEKMTADIVKSIQETGTFFGEISCLKKDGSDIPIETTAKTVFDPTGKPLFLIGINRDITDRKQAERDRTQLIHEQAARAVAEATQRRFSFLAQTSQLLATSLDSETTLANVAHLAVPTFADWCAIHLVEADGSLRQAVAVPAKPEVQNWMQDRLDHYPENLEALQLYLLSERPESLPATISPARDRTETVPLVNTRSHLCVPLQARGQILGILSLATIASERSYSPDDLSFAEDLAERIALAIDNARLYQQAQQALQQQAESLALIDALFAAAPVAVGFLDRELRYIRVNQKLADINGFSIEQHLGQRFRDLLPEMASQFEPHLQQVLDTGEPLLNFECSGEAPGQPGRLGYWLLNRYPVRGVNGQILGVGTMIADITDRKRAELAQQRSEERYRAFIKQSTEGIWRFELEQPLSIQLPEQDQIEHFYRDAYLAECNDVFAQMYGFAVAEELIGVRLGDLLVQSDPNNLIYLQRFIRMGYRLQDGESYEVDKDGNPKYFSNNLVGIIENGYLVRVWGTQREITERKQAEAMLRYLAETSSFLSTSLDYEATVQRVAQLSVPYLADWCAVDLVQADGISDRLCIACADPGKREWARQLEQSASDLRSASILARVLRSGVPELFSEISEELVMTAVAPNPELLPIIQAIGMTSAIIVPLAAHERVLGAIAFVSAESQRRYSNADLALAVDLARRAALAIDNARLYQEARSQRQSAELAKERTTRLQAVTAAFSEALTPAQVAEVVVNQGIAALGAMAGSVVLLDREGFLKLLATVGYPPELFDRWVCKPGTTAAPLADTVWTEKPIFLESAEIFALEYPHLTNWPGMTNSKAFAAIPLTVEGRTIGALGLSFALPQTFEPADRAFVLALGQQCGQAIARARLYEAEQNARAQAEAANRIKDEFLAVLSHELRTPLNPILGWVKLLRHRNLDAAKTTYALETVERNAKLLSQLIEDLLDVSRILRGKLSLNVSPVNLVGVIEAALETVHLAAAAKSIQIEAVLTPSVGLVLGDANRLQQVMWNLLSNAVKFTETGGRVEVRLEQSGTQAFVRVSDTGRGIDPEFLPHAFDYFRQEDSTTTRAFGGLGLGLAIVHHLVELHGGTVQAESLGSGRGATFTVALPLQEAVEVNPELSVTRPLSSVPSPLAGLRVLVVDDEIDTLNLLVFTLSESGAVVRAATSAIEALEILAGWSADILLSDIGMAQMDGYMLMQAIRALPPERGGTIPAIALTAYAGAMDRQKVLAAGFQQHLAKPAEPGELVEAIVSLVGRV